MKHQNKTSIKVTFTPQRLCYLAADSEEESFLLNWLNASDVEIEDVDELDLLEEEEVDREGDTALRSPKQLKKHQEENSPKVKKKIEDLTSATREQVVQLAEYKIIRGGTEEDTTFVLKKTVTETDPLNQKYELSANTLGKGSFGLVYEAKDLNNNETVAIKVLDIDTEDDTKRFLEEIEKMEAIDDTHIVQIKSAGRIPVKAMEGRNRIFLVMPKYEGSLEGLQRKIIAMSQSDKTKFLKDKIAPVVEALEKLHAQGLIHRDLKPENILVDQQGNLILSDLGVLSNIEAAQQSGLSVGALYCFSPEMLVKMTPNTIASDRFALGVTLYLTLTGKHPYLPATDDFSTVREEASMYSIPNVFINGRKPGMEKLLRDNQVPEEFIEILLTLLSPEPDDRMKISNISTAIEELPEVTSGVKRKAA